MMVLNPIVCLGIADKERNYRDVGLVGNHLSWTLRHGWLDSVRPWDLKHWQIDVREWPGIEQLTHTLNAHTWRTHYCQSIHNYHIDPSAVYVTLTVSALQWHSSLCRGVAWSKGGGRISHQFVSTLSGWENRFVVASHDYVQFSAQWWLVF